MINVQYVIFMSPWKGKPFVKIKLIGSDGANVFEIEIPPNVGTFSIYKIERKTTMAENLERIIV